MGWKFCPICGNRASVEMVEEDAPYMYIMLSCGHRVTASVFGLEEKPAYCPRCGNSDLTLVTVNNNTGNIVAYECEDWVQCHCEYYCYRCGWREGGGGFSLLGLFRMAENEKW